MTLRYLNTGNIRVSGIPLAQCIGKKEDRMSNDTEACEVKEIEAQDVERFHEISRILNILGNKTRVAMLAIMEKHDEVCACELQPALGLPQPTITSHLRKMYDIGLLKQKQVWKYSYYYMNPKYKALIGDILKSQENDISTSQIHKQKTDV